MEDAHGTALTNATRPRRRWWAGLWPPSWLLVAWLAAFPATWGLFALLDVLLPRGPVPSFMHEWGLGLWMALSVCIAPLVGAVLLFYALLRCVDARARLYTVPLFVVCFVGAFCRDVPSGLGGNGVLATLAAAALVTAEALVRRLRHELVTALCLLAAAVLELFWFCALWIAAGV